MRIVEGEPCVVNSLVFRLLVVAILILSITPLFYMGLNFKREYCILPLIQEEEARILEEFLLITRYLLAFGFASTIVIAIIYAVIWLDKRRGEP